MLALSLLRLTFLLLSSLIAVTAAPLTSIDMAARVEKRQVKNILEAKILIAPNSCEESSIYFGRKNSFQPVRQDQNTEIFKGKHSIEKTSYTNPIASVEFGTTTRNMVFQDLETVVQGSSKWDYIAKAMKYLQTKATESQLEFKFETGGEERWQKLLEKCGGKGSEQQGELKTSEVHTSSGSNEERKPSYGEFGKKGKMPTFTDILVGGSAGDATESKA
ncbi:hypothetical protein F5879DRAFT_918152 [Lentinula edodes]|nr:hypothetical protein HHX47_DHR5000256 [Lentinula edodes]KAJ3909690.1 hypothetical protein F5879DRAFT_918152 [Lentinula edodes]KAJ3919366.1 hypothetical protein F5877DRAFT_66607 [Lentinula edodes]